MEYQNIIVERQDFCTWITLNRPKANALSLDLMKELRDAVETADEDSAVRVILITGGESKFFAAGADIPTIAASLEDPMAEGQLLAEGVKTVNRIETCSTPVVAVVNGFALGGGCEVCLACHLRIAATTAFFGQPEINLGIIPGWGGTHRLPRLIGDSRAHDWLMTGRNVTAQEALEAGLVCQIVPPEELRDAAMKLAGLLAGKPAVAMRETLYVVYERALHPDQGQTLERESFQRAASSKDAVEGIHAFMEKRKPNFTGQ